jgi:hypothetical protein
VAEDDRRPRVAGWFFAASRANPVVRAGLQEFVAKGQRLFADYLTARIAGGEVDTAAGGRGAAARPDRSLYGRSLPRHRLVRRLGVGAGLLTAAHSLTTARAVPPNFSQRAAAGDAARLAAIFDSRQCLPAHRGPAAPPGRPP